MKSLVIKTERTATITGQGDIVDSGRRSSKTSIGEKKTSRKTGKAMVNRYHPRVERRPDGCKMPIVSSPPATELQARVAELEKRLDTSTEDSTSRAGTCYELAALLLRTSEYERALTALTRARQALDVRNHVQLANSISILSSSALIGLRRHEEARQVLLEAVERFYNDLSDTDRATVLNNLASASELCGDLVGAQATFERAIGLLRAAGDVSKLATTLNNVAIVYGKRGEDHLARASWWEAYSLHTKLEDKAGIANVLNNTARFLSNRGLFSGAEALCTRAVEIATRLDDLATLAVMRGNLATIHASVGEFEDAHAELIEKLSIHEQLWDAYGRGMTLLALGENRDRCDLLKEAHHYYSRAANLFSALGGPRELAEAQMGQAFSAPDPHSAIALGEQALATTKTLGDDSALAAALDNLGLLYGEAGDQETAFTLIQRALVLTDSLGDIEGTFSVLVNLAKVCEQADRFSDAIGYYERALTIARTSAHQTDIAEAVDRLRSTR
jgi:tetratricopeptide (TPR) repeat protein